MDLFTYATTLVQTEEERLRALESTIENGLRTFVDVGNALLEIRDSRLYRKDHSTFEDYCRERWGFTRMRASQLIAAAEVMENVNNCLQPPTNEAQARELAKIEPERQSETWTRVIETAPEGKITAEHVQNTVDEIRGRPHVANNSGNNEWYTPSDIIEAAREVMGSIDLDPASSDIANGIVKAKKYFTEEDNGLEKEWGGKVWMNPPYSQPAVDLFSQKLVKEYSQGHLEQAIVLVNNATETAWLQRMMTLCKAICFLRGRVKFIDMDGNATGAPLQGQAILFFDTDLTKAQEVFGEMGVILYG